MIGQVALLRESSNLRVITFVYKEIAGTQCYWAPYQVGGKVCLVFGFVWSILFVKCEPVFYHCDSDGSRVALSP